MEHATNRRSTGTIAALGLVTGLAAAVSASCCVLPLVIGGLGAGAGIFAALKFLSNYRMPLLVGSATLVTFAWLLYFRLRGARSTAIALALASVLVLTAASWNQFEPPLLRIIRTSR
jgi:mercuric ion transport protein